MHREAIRLLEYPKVRDILADFTSTSPGRTLAMELDPMDGPEKIRRAIRETAEMVRAAGTGFNTTIAGIEDVSQEVRRAAAGGGPLEGGLMLKVARLCEAAGTLQGALTRLHDSPRLNHLGNEMPQCSSLQSHITETIDSEGGVKDDATPELARLRRQIGSLSRNIENSLNELIRRAGVRRHLQYDRPSIYRDRYVLAVKSHSKGQIDGIVHGSSDSGATVYVEPMRTFDLGNELSAVKSEEEEEVERILWELTAHVARKSRALLRIQDLLAKVDLICAKAKMAKVFGMSRPRIDEGRVLELKEARHPILLDLTRELEEEAGSGSARPDFSEVVPIDVHLGDDFRLLIVTGPNTGGKTVALKTIGLLCLMARAGMFVPADAATVPVYDAIYADIGDEQSLEQSLSTFSSHMSRIIRILDQATGKSLVLLDELGAGTDPAEGAALGQTILRELVNNECSAVVTTHLGQLKTFASSSRAVENACVEFDSRTLRPTYRLSIGTAGQSNALEIAGRLGMPRRLLDGARDVLDGAADGEYRDMLQQVRQAKKDSEKRRRRAKTLEQHAQKLKAEYEEKLERIKEEEERTGADIGLKIKEDLEKLEQTAAELHDELRFSRKKLARTTEEIRNGLRDVLDRTEELVQGRETEMPLKPGDEVYVAKVHKWGTIERIDDNRGRATVNANNMQMEVDLEDLVRWGNKIDNK
ncbi:MAG: endonuclease MutS2 [Planctomycetota bacterium]